MITRHLITAFSVIGATGLQAQSSPITATAEVVTPITVTGAAPLDFGTIFQGVNKNINFNSAGSGRFSITGISNAQLALTFILPATLSNGVATMPISNYGIRVNDTNTSAGASALSVTSGIPVTTNLVNGALYVFIGGRVTSAAAQAYGTYTGTITLAAAYTGL